ncbi:unnamed protein product [Protopolystoma xenopodis]|uniref:Uncharacterized protein n=1 Tax=Protopolystoma xenopodis TaxID=117903 RepID=A0A3S5CI18_9PLAT|nr:unnamed protein product [Protopolystoma xenopodis]
MLGTDSALCPYCECKYQVVVCFLVVVISALTLYMIILMLLEPLLSHRLDRKEIPIPNIGNAIDSGLGNSTAPGAGPSIWRYTKNKFVTSGFPFSPFSTMIPKSQTIDSTSYGATSTPSTKQYGTNLFEELFPCPASKHDTEQQEHVDDVRPRQRVSYSTNDYLAGTLGSTGFGSANIFAGSGLGGISSHNPVSDAVHRAVDQQKRWKGNVEAQRARVFSEHSLLN